MAQLLVEGDASSRLEQAYRRLREGILAGSYSPNQRLVEAELCVELAVSRGTLRMALARLEQEGLIELELNRGARVKSFNLEEALDLLRVREALEGLAAGLAAERATDDELAQVGQLLEEMESLSAAGDLFGYSRANQELHRAVIAAARSPHTERLLGAVSYPLIRYQFRTILVPGRTADSVAEHRELVAALAARDAERAEAAMRRHIGEVRATLERRVPAVAY